MIKITNIYQGIFVGELFLCILCICLSFSASPDTIKEWIKNFVSAFIIFHIGAIILGGIYFGIPMFYHWLGTLG